MLSPRQMFALLADADLNQVIVTGVLRLEPTVDFQTATAAGLEGVKDLKVKRDRSKAKAYCC